MSAAKKEIELQPLYQTKSVLERTKPKMTISQRIQMNDQVIDPDVTTGQLMKEQLGLLTLSDPVSLILSR